MADVDAKVAELLKKDLAKFKTEILAEALAENPDMTDERSRNRGRQPRRSSASRR
jgi:hypothetical protein